MGRPPKTARNLTELCEALGGDVTPDELRALRLDHRDSMPKPVDRTGNRYNVTEFRNWWRAEGKKLLIQKRANEGPITSPKKTNLREAKLEEEIRRLRIQNDMLEGKLSDPSEQIRQFALAVQSIDRGLDEMALRLAPKVIGCKDEVEAKLLVEEEVRRLKIQLGDYRAEEDKEDDQGD